MTAGVVLADGLHMPESIRWRNGEIWFVDGPAIRVISADGVLRTHVETECPLLLGIAFEPEGALLTNDAVGRHVLRIGQDRSVSVVADLSAHGSGMINEVALLADGSLVVGDIGFDVLGGEAPRDLQLIHIAPNGKISRQGTPLFFANGMGVSDDGWTLFVAEYIGGAIWRYRLKGDGGLDAGVRIASGLGNGVDGIALSPDGTLWYANMEGGELVHLSADGKAIGRIDSGYGHASSVAVSGDEHALHATVLAALPAPGLSAQTGAVVRIALDTSKAEGV